MSYLRPFSPAVLHRCAGDTHVRQRPERARRRGFPANRQLQIRVHYPITGNLRVDADVADWAHQAVDTFQNTYGEEPDLGVPYELETTYSTTRSTPSVLSIVWKTASYTGGAHGNLEITTTTYDMKSGALIDLYDVFENLDTALDVMSRYCTKALTKSLGDMSQRRHPQRHRP